jgi:hypothetical protein
VRIALAFIASRSRPIECSHSPPASVPQAVKTIGSGNGGIILRAAVFAAAAGGAERLQLVEGERIAAFADDVREPALVVGDQALVLAELGSVASAHLTRKSVAEPHERPDALPPERIPDLALRFRAPALFVPRAVGGRTLLAAPVHRRISDIAAAPADRADRAHRSASSLAPRISISRSIAQLISL